LPKARSNSGAKMIKYNQ